MKNDYMKRVCLVYVCAMVILLSITFNGTYAFFTKSVTTTGNSEVEVITKEFNNITITGNTNVSAQSLLPGDSVTNTFTVSNTNDVSASYTLFWSDVTNTFVNTNDLIIELSYVVDGVTTNIWTSSDNKSFPTASNEVLTNRLNIGANKTHTYTLKVTYKNTSSNQKDDIGKEFGGNISIRY